ncbi:hypothetical protein Tsubulata_049689 [Turnera subulata]|uniref:Cytochrome P450 n=1 Tax=Turnera subulata TaxID=218843 RepID=A0A9Q0JQK3_9ROSI|nr:hypothetical protein Tsubulata_049689 [Turnera subulata]
MLAMDDLLLHSLVFIFILTLAIKLLFKRRKQERKLPPSPPAIPIIGHLHLLKQPLHRTFHSLSQKYGPIFSVKLGSRLAIVVSSPSLVEECFTKNDIVFANRPIFPSARHLSYNQTNMAAAPYGDHWRNLRRIGSNEIFSPTRLNMFINVRKDEVKSLARRLYHVCNKGFVKVKLRPMFMDLSFNILMRMVAGKRYFGEGLEQDEEARRFREIVTEFSQYAEVSDPVDIFPILKAFGFRGVEKQCMRAAQRLDVFLQELIDEHRNKKDGNTMINRLLDLQQSQPQYYTDEIIKGLMQQERKLPPSPPAIPIIGHLHLLKEPLHRTFHSLSQKYGPIFSVKLGSRLAIVVSSPSLVEECFTKNDIVFANRPFFPNSRYLSYNNTTMFAASYGDHWRNLRRIGSNEIFSPTRLNMFVDVRQDEVKRLVRRLYGVCKKGFVKVNLRPMFMDLSFNIVLRMVAGKRYYGEGLEQDEEARRFREILVEFFQFSAVSDPSDIFPILKVFGPTGIEKKCMRVGQRLDEFLQELIDEHRNKKGGNTMINRLLDLQESQPEYYTDEIIKGLMQE